MGHSFSISIERVVDLLGLERKPRSVPGTDSFYVRCPFCGGNSRRYKMNINSSKDVYFCFGCSSEGDASGALDLYSRVRFGVRTDRSNSKEIYAKLLKELGEDQPHRTEWTESAYVGILPAPDEKLDSVYSALLKLPCLKLSECHRENLLSRGLTEEDIRQNGYATFPRSGLIKFAPQALKRFSDDGYEEYRKGILSYYSRKDLLLGMTVAAELEKQGLSLDRVPGFFRLKDRWCFRGDAGILIPTRNRNGQIVGLQTRRDVKTRNGLRYMTLSSKGLPDGVTDRIARTHFPLANAEMTAQTQVFLTEGPLKADIAVSLLNRMGHENVSFIALQGVSATREIPAIAKELHSGGVPAVVNAFDMDKLTNPHVMEAARKAAQMFQRESVRTEMLLWGTDALKEKYRQMTEQMEANSLKFAPTGSITEDFSVMTCALQNLRAEKEAERWDGSEKGIDDHLLKQFHAGEA